MAGLRKSKSRSSGNKSNVVVICFLVFFILLSIGLGVSFYYGLESTEKAKQAAAKERKEKEAAIDSRNNYKMLALFAVSGYGGMDAEGLEMVELKERLGLFLENRKDEKEVREILNRIFPVMSKELEWVPAPPREQLTAELAAAATDDEKEKVMQKYMHFKKRYRDMYTQAAKELTDVKKEFEDVRAKLEKTKDFTANLEKVTMDKITAIHAEQRASGNNVLAAAKKRNVEFDELLKIHNQVKEDTQKKVDELEKKVTEKDNTIEELKTREMARLRAAANQRLEDRNDPAAGAMSRTSGDFPLALEIGTGRSIWDRPHGNVTRVDFDSRVVYISIGRNTGVKEGLTFNVFPSRDGRPHGMMRGTIEVTTVFPTTAIARITSMYDAGGQEILFSDQTRSRLDREASNAFKEGDLIFNMFFNARIAVAGAINLSGRGVGSAAEQNRQIDHFINLMKTYNVIVDAYVDLNNGERVGRLQPETRFLIRGDDPAGLPAPKLAAPADGAERPAEGDDRNIEDARVGKVRASLTQMKTEAQDRGLFIISAENFAFVVGYRPPRPANDVETSFTRPRPPYYSAAKTGVIPVNKAPGADLMPGMNPMPPAVMPAPPVEEKKVEEKKVEEKKDP